MKKTTTILLVFLILSISLDQVIEVVNFGINQQFIAENLCVNKNVIASNCHGKCQLKKAMKENNNAQEKRKVSHLETNKISLILADLQLVKDLPYNFKERQKPFYRYLYSFLFIVKIFRPPSC